MYVTCLFVFVFNPSIEVVTFHLHGWCILRVPDQNGISQAYYFVEIYHSGPDPFILGVFFVAGIHRSRT